jgi:hypothetical protein
LPTITPNLAAVGINLASFLTGRLSSIPHRSDVLGFYASAAHAAAVTAKAFRHLSERRCRRKQPQQKRNMQLALVLAPRAAAVSDQLVVARVKGESVALPPAPRITFGSSVAHAAILRRCATERPSSPGRYGLLYGVKR